MNTASRSSDTPFFFCIILYHKQRKKGTSKSSESKHPCAATTYESCGSIQAMYGCIPIWPPASRGPTFNVKPQAFVCFLLLLRSAPENNLYDLHPYKRIAEADHQPVKPVHILVYIPVAAHVASGRYRGKMLAPSMKLRLVFQ